MFLIDEINVFWEIVLSDVGVFKMIIELDLVIVRFWLIFKLSKGDCVIWVSFLVRVNVLFK